MPTIETTIALGENAIIEATVQMLKEGRADTFELSWSTDVEGTFDPDGDAPAGVPCTWTARATWRLSREDFAQTGTAGPSIEHESTAALACVDLLTKLGVDTTVLDLRDRDPRAEL